MLKRTFDPAFINLPAPSGIDVAVLADRVLDERAAAIGCCRRDRRDSPPRGARHAARAGARLRFDRLDVTILRQPAVADDSWPTSRALRPRR